MITSLPALSHDRHPLEFYNVEDLWDDADDVIGSLGRGLEEYGTKDEMTFSYEGFNALIDPSDLPAGAVAGPPGELQYASRLASGVGLGRLCALADHWGNAGCALR
jgi:hypothetical protein